MEASLCTLLLLAATDSDLQEFFSRGRIAKGIKMSMKDMEIESWLKICLYTPLYNRLWSTLDKEDRTRAASMTKRTHHFSVSRKFQHCYLQNPDSISGAWNRSISHLCKMPIKDTYSAVWMPSGSTRQWVQIGSWASQALTLVGKRKTY